MVVAPLAFLDPEYPAWLAKERMLASCDLGELVVVGDSRAAVDIIPTVLPLSATSLAVGGGSPIEAYVAASRALGCPTPPRRVIVSFNAVHFTEPDLFWERSVHFGFVRDTDPSRFAKPASEQLNDPSVYDLRRDELTPNAESALYTAHFPSFYFNSLVKSGGIASLAKSPDLGGHHRRARQYYFGVDAGSGIVAAEGHLETFAPLPVLDHYFDRLLALLAERRTPVDFVAMPMNEATSQSLRPEIREQFAAYLAGYAARYQFQYRRR